jgi:LacI family transcriptional regulator
MNKCKITIESVAKLAGVSRATVGRVIGNYGSASEETREKVLEAVRQLEYVPNINAQGLRGHSTKTIAVVVGNIKNNYCNSLVYAIETEAIKKGFNVLISNTNENAGKEVQQLMALKSRNVDGMIIISANKAGKKINSKYQYLYDGDTPVVLVDRKIKNLTRDFIGSDDIGGTYEATKYLISLGHTKIGVLGTGNFPTNQDRITGYKKALKEKGIEYDSELIVQSKYSEDNAGKDACKEILSRNKGITALLILNDTVCGGAYLELQERQIEVPKDLSVITWDDQEMNKLLGITTVAQNVEKIGELAVNRIFEILDNPETVNDYKTVQLKVNLKIRKSCSSPKTK